MLFLFKSTHENKKKKAERILLSVKDPAEITELLNRRIQGKYIFGDRFKCEYCGPGQHIKGQTGKR